MGPGNDGSGRRVHLPLVVAREPAVAEGSRSLSAWSAIRQDLANVPTLADELRKDPIKTLARYNIRPGPHEVTHLVDALLRTRSDE